MSQFRYNSAPERDVNVLFQQKRTQMVDNTDHHSTASSDISENTRNQILGKSYRRKHNPTVHPVRNPSPTTPITKKNRSQASLYHTPKEVTGKQESASWEIISIPLTSDKTSGSNHRAEANKSILSASPENSVGHRNPSVGSTPVDFHKNNTADSQPKNRETAENLQDSKSISSSPEVKRFQTSETQTLPISIAVASTDPQMSCRCPNSALRCPCKRCKFDNCHFESRPTVEDTSDLPTENLSDSSNQTLDLYEKAHSPEVYRRVRCACNCRSRWTDSENQSTVVDDFSDSDDSYTTDFLNLPYQNNEEYLHLLRELEKKLIARNRDRVRKTMLEFERLSRQNQNLEKPICEYSGDDAASVLQKLHIKNKPPCCKCGRKKKVNSDIMQNEKRWDELNYVESVIQSTNVNVPQAPNQVERRFQKNKWQLNPRTGEWVKVSSLEQADFFRSPQNECIREGYRKLNTPMNCCKKECCCRQTKRR